MTQTPAADIVEPTPVFDDVTLKRFWANVEILSPDECWPWKGRFIKKDGRGILWDSKTQRTVTAPRVSLQIKLGKELPRSVFACHTCDNPVCVNPHHLWEGSNKDNLRDASEKGVAVGKT